MQITTLVKGEFKTKPTTIVKIDYIDNKVNIHYIRDGVVIRSFLNVQMIDEYEGGVEYYLGKSKQEHYGVLALYSDAKKIEFQVFAEKDEYGFPTNLLFSKVSSIVAMREDYVLHGNASFQYILG